jgi:ATP-binding cassette subfamily B protein
MQYFEEEEFDTTFSGRTVLRILSHIKPYWWWLLFFVGFVITVTILDSYFTFLTKRIIDEGIMNRDLRRLYQIITVFGGMILVQMLMVFGFIYMAGILGERVQYDLRKDMFSHLQALSLSYFDKTAVGWIMARVTSDSERIAQLITWGLVDTMWAVMSIGTGTVFMLIINWRLALIVVFSLPGIIFVALKFKKLVIVEYRKVRRINSKITGAYNENITGVKVVKALCREKKNLEEFGELTQNMYRSGFRAAWLAALFLPVVQLIGALTLALIFWVSGRQVGIGALTVGGIQAFISYVTFMLWPIQDLARIYAELQNSIASAERIFSLLDSRPEVVDKPQSFDPGSIRGEIRFDDVDFYYEKENPVLKGFSVTINPGETIALVGPTGGGKTTIANLVCRFYEPKAGIVRINGRDYTEYSLESIHSRLGIVLQDPHLFSGTIRENIRYGRTDASDSEVEEAARISRAHDFICTLEKNYDEEVGEGGNLLSVGQKQLISLARALLARPDIFIMDEATSSIDTVTEELIQKGMEALMEGRTSFIIAHRLSTIRKADRILVIKEGEIEEMGSHRELIKARGHYYNLYTRQLLDEREHALLG